MPYEMNQDMIIDVLSHCPASVVDKFRIILNKECYKRTYNSSFIKLNLQRTNSVSGFFLQYMHRYNQFRIRIRFLPPVHEMNQDMIIDVLSRCPASVVDKFRIILNKECYKRTYNSSFIKLNLQRTNSVSGFFLQYMHRYNQFSAFVEVLGNRTCESEISLDFLPQGRVAIVACDASHGILLCVNDLPVKGRRPLYMICKPTTKQYLIIPKPKIRYSAVKFGLMVIGSNPLRYNKILRLSNLPCREKRRYSFNSTYVCEVFDSDSFAWKRLNNVEIPEDNFLSPLHSIPTASCGVLHWLTFNNNVFRFCLITETWLVLPVPECLARARSIKLARYEGKLGIINLSSSEGKDYDEIWVLESYFGNSWLKMKEIKNIGIKPVWFSSNDTVTLADWDRILLYNLNNGKSQKLQIRNPRFCPWYNSDISYFPFRSDYERVEIDGRFNGYRLFMLNLGIV